jgi:phage-related protein
VGSPVTNEEEAVYTVISDLAAAGLVGATRTMTRPCTWKYKGEECGATSSLPTCDFTYDLDTGCKGRDRQFRFNGFIFDAERLTLTIPGYTGGTPDYPPHDDPGGGYGGIPPVFGY